MAGDVVVRPAQSGDVAAIRACARAAYKRYVAAIGRDPAPMVADFSQQVAQGIVSVAADGQDSIAGYIVCYPDGADFHVENIAVSPNRQGAGIGRVLMAHADACARTAGCTALALYTNIHMSENLTLYPHLGFVETDRREEDGFHRVYFRKPLGGS